MRGCVIAKLFDLRQPIQRRLNNAPLDAGTSAVDDANFAEAGARRGIDVVLDYGWDVTRGERMQVDLALDGHVMSHGYG